MRYSYLPAAIAALAWCLGASPVSATAVGELSAKVALHGGLGREDAEAAASAPGALEGRDMAPSGDMHEAPAARRVARRAVMRSSSMSAALVTADGRVEEAPAEVMEDVRPRHRKPSAGVRRERDTVVQVNQLPPDQKRRPRTFNGPVDFVYCWAGETCGSANDSYLDHDAGCDNGEMRYSLRLLQKHAPWARRIILLVNGPLQRPWWLPSDGHVELLDRCALFDDPEDCPTFNTHACQAVMHRVPGLAEHFVYMEDDYFVTAPSRPTDFFSSDGRPLLFVTFGRRVHMYGMPVSLLNGSDLPPEKVPARLEFLPHAPMPALRSFAQRMERHFPDWYAFSRSHKKRFRCCDVSLAGACPWGLDESLLRVYPLYLRAADLGVPRPVGDAHCQVEDHQSVTNCFAKKLREGERFANANGATPATWAEVAHLLELNVRDAPIPKIVPELWPKKDSLPWRVLCAINILLTLGVAVAAQAALKPEEMAAPRAAVPQAGKQYDDLQEGLVLSKNPLTTGMCIFMYVLFMVAYPFTQHFSANVPLNVILPTVLIYAWQFLLSSCLYLFLGGKFSLLKQLMKVHKTTFLVYWAAAAALAHNNLLSSVTLGMIAPAEYQLLLHLRVALIAPMWRCMGRSMTCVQWCLVGVCVWSAAVLERGVIRGAAAQGEGPLCAGTYWIVGLQLLLISLGHLANDSMLTDTPLSLCAENVVLSAQAMLFSGAMFVAAEGFGGLTHHHLDLIHVFEPAVMTSIFVGGIVGISASLLPAVMGNVTTELPGMVITFITVALDWWVLRLSRWDLLDLQSALLISSALTLFSAVGRRGLGLREARVETYVQKHRHRVLRSGSSVGQGRLGSLKARKSERACGSLDVPAI